MSARELMPGQPVTQRGDAGSADLIEIIQRLVRNIRELEARTVALEAEVVALDARVTALEP